MSRSTGFGLPMVFARHDDTVINKGPNGEDSALRCS